MFIAPLFIKQCTSVNNNNTSTANTGSNQDALQQVNDKTVVYPDNGILLNTKKKAIKPLKDMEEP